MKVAICDDSEQDIADLKEKLLKIIEGYAIIHGDEFSCLE